MVANYMRVRKVKIVFELEIGTFLLFSFIVRNSMSVQSTLFTLKRTHTHTREKEKF